MHHTEPYAAAAERYRARLLQFDEQLARLADRRVGLREAHKRPPLAQPGPHSVTATSTDRVATVTCTERGWVHSVKLDRQRYRRVGAHQLAASVLQAREQALRRIGAGPVT